MSRMVWAVLKAESGYHTCPPGRSPGGVVRNGVKRGMVMCEKVKKGRGNHSMHDNRQSIKGCGHMDSHNKWGRGINQQTQPTYGSLSVWICWVSKMDALHAACLHSDDPTGDSPQPRPPRHHCLGPVVEGLDEAPLVKEPVVKISTICAGEEYNQHLSTMNSVQYTVDPR